ncbi:MAG: hypothetical protein WAN20_09840 [Pseudonocardiaceae bacterium]
MKSESCAAAVVAEVAAQLPAHGPGKTNQVIKDSCRDRAALISRYFEQLGIERLDT